VNLIIISIVSLWKRGQNKPHVSFNDILEIKHHSQISVFYKIYMYVKMKTLCEEHYLIVWYFLVSLKFTSWGMWGKDCFGVLLLKQTVLSVRLFPQN